MVNSQDLIKAWVRLNEANTAKDVLDKVLAAGDGKLIIGDNEVTTRIVEGEEEAEFWKEANEKRAAQRSRGRQGGFKRKNNQYTNFRSSKKFKNTSTDQINSMCFFVNCFRVYC